MKLIKAIDIVKYYSKLILSDNPNRWIMIQDMHESEKDELEDAVEKIEEFIKDIK